MKNMVIDASMAATWTLEDEKIEAGDKIMEETKKSKIMVPDLFWHEYRSILLTKHRRGKLKREKIAILLKDLRSLEIKEFCIEADNTVISLAFQHNLSAYDAVYLALAIQEKAIMATNDKKLLQAAIAQGLEYRTTLAHGGDET